MFTIQSTGAKVVAVTNRAEKHGKNALVPAQTIRLSFMTSALHLDELDTNLRKSLFKKPSNKPRGGEEGEEQPELALQDNGNLTEPKFKGKVPSVPFKDKMPGYTLIMGSGLTDGIQVEQPNCTLSDFVIQALDGGSVKIEVNVSYKVDEEHAGYFACQVQQLVNIDLLPPGFEEEDAQPELEAAEA